MTGADNLRPPCVPHAKVSSRASIDIRPRDSRRFRFIDRLLASDDFPKHWGDVWTDWSMGRLGTNEEQREGMRAWSSDDMRVSRLVVCRSGWFAAKTMNGVMKATLKSDADN